MTDDLTTELLQSDSVDYLKFLYFNPVVATPVVI
jgi:hypothetical protein